MNTCYLIGSAPFERGCFHMPRDGDFVICADGGYDRAVAFGCKPDLVVGDFDSSSCSENDMTCEVIRLNPEKDDTDMISAARIGLKRGYRNFKVYGGFGGRFDHTLANIQLLAFLLENGAEGTILDGAHTIWMIENRTLEIQRRSDCYLSVFAFSDTCSGVTLRGVKYPLDEAVLTPAYPIGVSNEFTEPKASVTVKQGRLLVVLAPKHP